MIKFNEQDHTYHNEDGEELISVTTLLGFLKPEFDPRGEILARCAKREKITPEELKKRWDKEKEIAAELGTSFHTSAEHFIKHKEVLDDEWSNYIKGLPELIPDAKVYDTEQIVYCNDLLLAGTIDLICWHDNNCCTLIDYKTNKKIDKYSAFRTKYNPPISHLYECNFTTYCLQLNIYSVLLEKQGFICEDLALIHIDRKKGDLVKYPIPFMLEDTQKVLDHYYQNQNFFLRQKKLQRENIDI